MIAKLEKGGKAKLKKWYLVITVLAITLVVISCEAIRPKPPIPPAAISEIYALGGSEAFAKYVEVKEVQDRKDFCYIMVYVKSLPGEFTTLEDALAQAKVVTRMFLESAVEILNRHGINQDVAVWVQLPLKEGGVNVLGHAEYDGKTFHDFELYEPKR